MADATKRLELVIEGRDSPSFRQLIARLERLNSLIGGKSRGNVNKQLNQQYREQVRNAAELARLQTEQAKKRTADIRTQMAAEQGRHRQEINNLNKEIQEMKKKHQEVKNQQQQRQMAGGGRGLFGTLHGAIAGKQAAMGEAVVGRALGAVGLGGGAGGGAIAGPALGVLAVLVSIGQTAKKAFDNFRRLYYFTMSILFLYQRVGQIVVRFWAGVAKMVMKAAEAMVQFGLKLLDIAGKMDMLELRLNAVFGQQGPLVLERIIDLAREMPHTIDDMIKGFIRAKSMGVWDLFGERGIFAASDLAIVFDRNLEDALMAIGQAGANRMDRLTRGFGIRGSDLGKYGAHLGPQGQLTGASFKERQDNMLAAILLIEDRWGGATKTMQNSFDQRLSNMADLWNDFALKLRSVGFTHIWAQFLGTVQNLFDQFEKTGRLDKVVNLLMTLSYTLRSVFENLLTYLGPLFDEWMPKLESLVEVIGNKINNEQFWNKVASYMNAAFKIGEGFVINMLNLVDALEKIVPTFLEVMAALTETFIRLAPLMLKLGQATIGMVALAGIKLFGDDKQLAAFYALNKSMNQLAQEVQGLAGPGGLGATLQDVAGELRNRSVFGREDIMAARFGPPGASPRAPSGVQTAGVFGGGRLPMTIPGMIGGKGGKFDLGSQLEDSFINGGDIMHNSIVSGSAVGSQMFQSALGGGSGGGSAGKGRKATGGIGRVAPNAARIFSPSDKRLKTERNQAISAYQQEMYEANMWIQSSLKADYVSRRIKDQLHNPLIPMGNVTVPIAGRLWGQRAEKERSRAIKEAEEALVRMPAAERAMPGITTGGQTVINNFFNVQDSDNVNAVPHSVNRGGKSVAEGAQDVMGNRGH